MTTNCPAARSGTPACAPTSQMHSGAVLLAGLGSEWIASAGLARATEHRSTSRMVRIGRLLRSSGWTSRSRAVARAGFRGRAEAELGEPERKVVRADAAAAVVVATSEVVPGAEIVEPRGKVVGPDAAGAVQVVRGHGGRRDQRAVREDLAAMQEGGGVAATVARAEHGEVHAAVRPGELLHRLVRAVDTGVRIELIRAEGHVGGPREVDHHRGARDRVVRQVAHFHGEAAGGRVRDAGTAADQGDALRGAAVEPARKTGERERWPGERENDAQ